MSSFDLDPVERVTAGAVGEPGHRVFFVQAAARGELVTVLVEKEQVQALATSIIRLLSMIDADVEAEADVPDEDLELAEPIVPEWRGGAMALDYDRERDRVVIVVQEALPEDSDEEPGVLRVVATQAQAQALAVHAAAVCASGRPACRVCGQPMDPEGHTCPGLNGHREVRV